MAYALAMTALLSAWPEDPGDWTGAYECGVYVVLVAGTGSGSFTVQWLDSAGSPRWIGEITQAETGAWIERGLDCSPKEYRETYWWRLDHAGRPDAVVGDAGTGAVRPLRRIR